MKGKLYGIGIGPGDPELLTLKAVRVLRSADVVVIPEGGKERGSTALEIAGGYLKEGVKTVTQTFPMVRDEEEKKRNRFRNAMEIRDLVLTGNIVVFLTLGDSMLYSTYIYVLDYLKNSGIEIETVPGVTSFSAIAARYNIPLAMQEEELRVIPLNRSTDIESPLGSSENLVFMKVSSDSKRLADELKKVRGSVDCLIASKCGREEESVSRDIGSLYEDVPYMTTVIVKKKKVR
jgi:precorrin-2/cobalt-factor-2 C20-methyltransferase